MTPILATLVLAWVPQSTPAPQPQFQAYGSLSRQMTVYNNLRSQEEHTERVAYRRMREEINRQIETPVIRVYARTTLLCERDRLTIRRQGFSCRRNNRL